MSRSDFEHFEDASPPTKIIHSPPLRPGDVVAWVEEDEDIPQGSTGEVLGFMGSGRAKCRFPGGTFALQPHSLIRISSQGQERAWYLEPRLSPPPARLPPAAPTAPGGLDLLQEPLVVTSNTPKFFVAGSTGPGGREGRRVVASGGVDVIMALSLETRHGLLLLLLLLLLRSCRGCVHVNLHLLF